MLLPACSEPASDPPSAQRVEWDGAALRIQLSCPLDLVRVELLDGEDRAVRAWTFTPGSRSEVKLEPAPPEGHRRLRLVEQDGATHLLAVYTPNRPVAGIRAKLELPWGVPDPSQEVWLPINAPLTLSLIVERDAMTPLATQIRLSFPSGMKVLEASERGWATQRDGGQVLLIRETELRDREQFLLDVVLEEAARPLTVKTQIAGVDKPLAEAQARVRGADAVEVQRLLNVTESSLPTDRYGTFDATRRANVLQMPTPFGRYLRERLGGTAPPVEQGLPFCFQSVRLENNSAIALAVEVRSWVCDTKTEQPHPNFAPAVYLGKATPFVSVPVLVPANSSTLAVLPLFAEADTLPGDYQRQIRVRMIGTDAVLATLSVPLRVERTDRPAYFITLLAALITALALPLLAWRGPRLLRRFEAVELIQIALFASAAFLLVMVPVRLLATLVNVLVPMFSPFLLGLYSQVIGVAVLGALIVLVPRPGVVLLAGATRFLLNGVFFGAFSPVDFLYVIPVLLAGEACLWLAGITRCPERPVSALQLAPACALMGLAAAGLQLSLEMSLYRLFLADWYVFLFLLLDGTLYPALGACLGVNLGAALKRTAE